MSPFTFGQFTAPERITAPNEATTSFDQGLDFFGNLVLAHEEGAQLAVETLGGHFTDHAALGEGMEPRLAFSPLGAFIAYSAPSPGSQNHRIVVRTRTSNAWSAAHSFSPEDGGDARVPAIQVTRQGIHAVAWERRAPGASPRIWFRRSGAPAVEIGQGEAPSLAIEGSGRSHIFFLRQGDIFHAKESSTLPGSFGPAVNVTQTPLLAESPPSSAIHEQRRILLCFEREGNILLANDLAGDFSTPSRIATGGARPAMAISPNGALSLVFETGTDLKATLGTTFLLPPPVTVLTSAAKARRPVVAVDSFANTFVAFLRDGALYSMSNAGVPQASFEADPLRGEAPLKVAFLDRSSGDVTAWAWEFGDGGTSSEQNPVHTYELSGQYSVRLRVTGPGGESPIASEKLVLVLDPRNEMHAIDVAAFPGQEKVHIPVLATHARAAQGFTLAAVYDPEVLTVREVVYDETHLNGIGPELFAVSVSDDPAEPFITAGILFDVTEPFDGRVLPPGQNHRIANIIVNVSPDARAGTFTPLELMNQVGRPPLNNIFTINGFTLLPVLGKPAKVHIRRLSFPPPRFFRRGDADSNGLVNLTDGITILSYLFTGDKSPACFDAADVTDSGSVDVSDAAFLLNFLFKSGEYPPPPFPDWGLDPTDDELTDCLLR